MINRGDVDSSVPRTKRHRRGAAVVRNVQRSMGATSLPHGCPGNRKYDKRDKWQLDREEIPTTGARCQERANVFRRMCKTKPHELVKAISCSETLCSREVRQHTLWQGRKVSHQKGHWRGCHRPATGTRIRGTSNRTTQGGQCASPTKPSTPGCHILLPKGCPAHAAFNKRDTWQLDTLEHMTTGKRCHQRAQDFKSWCKTDWFAKAPCSRAVRTWMGMGMGMGRCRASLRRHDRRCR